MGLLMVALAMPASAAGRFDGACAALKPASDRLRFLIEQRQAMPAEGAEACGSAREIHRYAGKVLAKGTAYRDCPQYRRARREAARYERLGRARCAQAGR